LACILRSTEELVLLFVCASQYNKHLFVHIGSNVNYADPQLEV